MNYLETIEKLHPDIVHHFLQTGECKGIPEEIQLFLKQMQWAAEIYEYERNIKSSSFTSYSYYGFAGKGCRYQNM